jgi:hypothetical protein
VRLTDLLLPKQLTVTEQGLKGTEEYPIINLPETIGNIQRAHLQNNESATVRELYTTFSLLLVTAGTWPYKRTGNTI